MNYRISILSLAICAFAFATVPAQAQQPAAADQQQQQQQQKAKKQKKPTTRQEADQSVQSGTVPAKYRSSVPKEYQKYVPFAPSGR